MTDEDKERIRFNTELIKLLIMLFLATGGGAISLILHELPRGKHMILAASGMMFAIASGIMTYRVYYRTKRLMK